MLRTDLNATRSELQAADSDFQKSLLDVKTTLKTRVSQSITLKVCRFFFSTWKVPLLACLFICLFVSLLQILLTNALQKIIVSYRFRFLELYKSC